MRRSVCWFCQTRRQCRRNRQLNRPVCLPCYRQHLQPRQKCCCCHLKRPARAHSENGRPVCDNCYARRRLRRCSVCHRVKPVHVRTGRGLCICWSCYAYGRLHRQSTYRVCRGCRRRRPVLRRFNRRPYCSSCYYHFRARECCVLCHNLATVSRRLPRHRPVCANCNWRKLRHLPSPKSVRQSRQIIAATVIHRRRAS